MTFGFEKVIDSWLDARKYTIKKYVIDHLDHQSEVINDTNMTFTPSGEELLEGNDCQLQPCV